MYCNLHTDRLTVTKLYCGCYEEGGRVVQVTLICTQTGELQQNVNVFVMRKKGG
jgi:hypothetical protein